MKLRTFAATLAMSFGLVAPVWAENLAVVMSNLSYRDQVNLPSGPSVGRIVRSLQGAGFNTILMQNQFRGQAIANLTQIRQRMLQADRIVIVLNGHIVSANGAPWLLAPRGKAPTDFASGSC